MGLRTIAVLNNDSVESLDRDRNHSISTLVNPMRSGSTGAFGPDAVVVAVRSHDRPGLLYFNGRTLVE